MMWTLTPRRMVLAGLVVLGVGLGEAAGQEKPFSAEQLEWAKVHIETKIKQSDRKALAKAAEAAGKSLEETFLSIQAAARKARSERRRRKLDEDSGDVDVPE